MKINFMGKLTTSFKIFKINIMDGQNGNLKFRRISIYWPGNARVKIQVTTSNRRASVRTLNEQIFNETRRDFGKLN